MKILIKLLYLKPFLIAIFSLSLSHVFAQVTPLFPVQKLGQTIYEGVFTGNGLIGTMSYLKGDAALRIDFGRTDVYEHRNTTENILLNKGRIPIGHLEIFLNDDKIQSAKGNMDLVRADANTTIYAQKGSLAVKTTTLSQSNYILIEINDKLYNGKYRISWKPEKAISTTMRPAVGYEPNPDGKDSRIGNVIVYDQPFLAGGGYTVAYKIMPSEYGKFIVATIGYSQTDAQYKAQTVENISNWHADVSKAYAAHQLWWKNYFTKSTLRIPDKGLQDFYQMQLYKLACATRSDKPAIDLQGPWTSKTPWPAYWHNLNIQLTYSPVYMANHLEISQSLINMIDRNVDHLAKNVPQPYQYNSAGIGRVSSPDMIGEIPLRLDDKTDVSPPQAELGNLTWILFYYYQHYRYTMDRETGNKLFSTLKKAINYYLHLLEKNEQAKYHIGVKTNSPEYPRGYGFDTNYDLSILRWGLKTLIGMNIELQKKDPLNEKWQEVLLNLIDYPQNENGYMIAKDIPFAVSHRHYSHLLMIYPFYEINWEQPENRALIQKSVDHWQSMPNALQGYSFTGLASIKAMMGDGNAARNALNALLNIFVKPNTLYAESGPVIETPLSAMTSIQELCLQYWNQQVRVFPAIPSDWKDVSFDDFRTDGAFLISALRKDGKNTSVTVKSEKGGILKIKPNLTGGFKWTAKGKVKLLKQTNEVYEFEMRRKSVLFMNAHQPF